MGIKARQRLAGIKGIRRDARQLVLHHRGNADNAGSLAALCRIFQGDSDDDTLWCLGGVCRQRCALVGFVAFGGKHQQLAGFECLACGEHRAAVGRVSFPVKEGLL